MFPQCEPTLNVGSGKYRESKMTSWGDEKEEEYSMETIVVPTQSLALVSVSELRSAADKGTTTTPIVLKTYAQRDVLRHGLDEAVRMERDALVRLAEEKGHNGVPQLLAARVGSGALTLVMRRAPGIPASQLRTPLSTCRAAAIAFGVATALRTVHARDIVHTDVVPRNVLVDLVSGGSSNHKHGGHHHQFRDNDNAHDVTSGSADDNKKGDHDNERVSVCLVDFGSAFLRGVSRPHASWTSSAAALPPELRDASSRVPTPLADVWSLGTLVWTLLAHQLNDTSHPVHMEQFLLGDMDLHAAFWQDCAPQGQQHSRENLIQPFDFVSTCLQSDPMRRFCKLKDAHSVTEAPWRDLVDYKKIFAHPFFQLQSGSDSKPSK